VTSDLRKKKDVVYFTKNNLYDHHLVEFIMDMKPCKYKYKNGTSDRYHYGFIA
jgi:hypothetical protein